MSTPQPQPAPPAPPKKSSTGKVVAWSCGGCVLLMILGSLFNSPDDQQGQTPSVQTSKAPAANKSSAEPYIGIAAIELMAAYENNAVAADTKYEGKLLRITGSVKDFGKDLMDTAYITLESGESFNNAQCMFASSQEESLAQLSKGDHVLVEGRCSGEAIGNVIIKNCQLVR